MADSVSVRFKKTMWRGGLGFMWTINWKERHTNTVSDLWGLKRLCSVCVCGGGSGPPENYQLKGCLSRLVSHKKLALGHLWVRLWPRVCVWVSGANHNYPENHTSSSLAGNLTIYLFRFLKKYFKKHKNLYYMMSFWYNFLENHT